jgi:hypothetical protein
MLLYKLLRSGIDGKIYTAIKSMYEQTVSCARINNIMTQWFDCKKGVVKGNSLSPTLFAVFINDLVAEINSLDLGVSIGKTKNLTSSLR